MYGTNKWLIDWLIDPDLLDETTSMKDLQGLLANGNVLVIGKWFEPMGISYWFVVIFRVRIAFRKTVVGDWRFDYLSGSHLQSQVKSCRQMMVFMPLVLVLIGQFCRDLIGPWNVEVLVLVIAKENSFSCIYFKDLERKPVSEMFEWNLVVTSNLLSTWGKSLTAHVM